MRPQALILPNIVSMLRRCLHVGAGLFSLRQ